MGKSEHRIRENYLERSIEKVTKRLEASHRAAREREEIDLRALGALQSNIDN